MTTHEDAHRAAMFAVLHSFGGSDAITTHRAECLDLQRLDDEDPEDVRATVAAEGRSTGHLDRYGNEYDRAMFGPNEDTPVVCAGCRAPMTTEPTTTETGDAHRRSARTCDCAGPLATLHHFPEPVDLDALFPAEVTR